MHAHRRSISAFMILAAASAGIAGLPAQPVAAAASFCSVGASYPGTMITWTGKGNGHTWGDARNWRPAKVPDAHQTPATYQTQYVCIGTGKGGKAADVTIAGSDARHIGGIDVGQGAQLVVKPGGRLFLGAVKGTAAFPSSVDRHSQLQLDASTLGGNSPLTVAGTLRWTGQLIGSHKDVATQTSSECAFDPTIPACPGQTTPGGGRTVIAASGKLRVDGVKFGGVDLTDQRTIDNFGTIKLTKFGYIAMDNATQLIDQPHSSLQFDGLGGIYRGSKHGGSTPPRVRQRGAIVRHGKGHNMAVVAVPVHYGTPKPKVSVLGGQLVLNAARAPTAKIRRATSYGTGTCALVKMLVCRHSFATAARPQTAVIGASSESAAPKVSKVAASLGHAPKTVHGHRVLGKTIHVVAPTKKTSHATHLTFTYDASTKGLKAHTVPTVYRNKKKVTLCRVHGLTALNTSCVFSEGVSHSGKGIKGDLTIVLITIQPNGKWLVAR
jgi:hypothetical protein